jgi:hypothetical protein
MMTAILPYPSWHFGGGQPIGLFLHRITPARQTLDYGKSKLAIGYGETSPWRHPCATLCREKHSEPRLLAYTTVDGVVTDRLTLLVSPLNVSRNCATVIFGSFRISRSTRCANRSSLYQCAGIGRPGVHLVIGRSGA